ncbi:MAG: glycosyltransferase family 39 protein [Chloroflexia bacterium]
MGFQRANARRVRCAAGWLAIAILLGLVLRGLVLSWHWLYPLSGDEAGFFEQARAFVQGKGYHDLELMRGPLYPFFLAIFFRIFGAEVTAARVAQLLLSAGTVPVLYLWASLRHGERAGRAAAILGAVFFPFALQPTLLLSETLFLFLLALGMVTLEYGCVRPGWKAALVSGVLFGLAALTRSTGLPWVALAAVGIGWCGGRVGAEARRGRHRSVGLGLSALVLAGAALVIVPWTARNVLTYRAFILIDTTGATNLWLDNDPELGRDRVKAELLRLPEGERQGISVRRGLAAIRSHPQWFAAKCWRELRAFFALEYFDDFLRRPAIWYPPGEVWARMLLGDALYLLLVGAGLVGLACHRPRTFLLDLAWLVYVPATTTLFHVELRYRLPFLFALVPYAAAALVALRPAAVGVRRWAVRTAAAGILVTGFLALLLAQANYPRLAYQVAVKRVHVVLGRQALRQGEVVRAAEHARAALRAYPESAEARILLAETLRLEGKRTEAETMLREAIAYRSGHPHPHLLLGDLLRTRDPEQAARELAFEGNSLEDLQRWALEHFASAVPADLDLGSHLELGHVLGWHLPERAEDGTTFRWSDASVRFRLSIPTGGPAQLVLRMSAGRPEGLPLPRVTVWQGDLCLGAFVVANGWHTYALPLGNREAGAVLWFELRSETYRPHRYDRHLADNRPLGVMVDRVEVVSGP